MDNIFHLRKQEITKQAPARTIRKNMLKVARMLSQHEDLDGYAIVSWDSRGNDAVGWEIGDKKIIPECLLPEFTRVAITSAIAVSAALDMVEEEE